MSTPAAHPSPALRRSSPSAGRVVALIAGSLLALLAAALIIGGAALLAAHLTQRDDDGFYTSPTTRLATTTYALTGEGIDLGDVRGSTADWSVESFDATTRIRVDPAGEAPLFVGDRAGGRRAGVPPRRRSTTRCSDVDHRDGDLAAGTTGCPGAAPRSRPAIAALLGRVDERRRDPDAPVGAAQRALGRRRHAGRRARAA